MNNFEIEDVEWAQRLERGLGEYMDTLWEAFWNEQESDEDTDIVTESGIYFCGNDCCVTREMLWYTTPRIIQGYLDGKVKLTDGE